MKKPGKLYLFKLIVIAGLATTVCVNVSAQVKVNCAKLLKQHIAIDTPQKVANEIIKYPACFGFDNIDLKIFGDGPTLAPLLAKHSAGSGKVTYADLLADINTFKRDTAYTSIHNQVSAQTTLEATKISPETWESSVKLLKIIGMPDSEMENFHKFMLEKNGKNWNYRQLVVAYRMKQEMSTPPKQK
ncbi:hypothetical protein KXD93_27635 [Mucilaginibacter sp. BJC16-A38]|uniref:hypothetical protein n=1 Tax=Mucilaginibacter phenanthrenivorans TaxID=1234842 RepID=UPI002157FF1A|nr:hypothetical protein [Mucilaginibacter phenanthrenivorans]MCR8561457.1 hypothetical protein [Mucilaginibacter phenanthrenivorans]